MTTEKMIQVHMPTLKLPCGDGESGIPFPLNVIADLRAAGVEILDVENCPVCQGTHELQLEPLTRMTISARSSVFLPGNGLQL